MNYLPIPQDHCLVLPRNSMVIFVITSIYKTTMVHLSAECTKAYILISIHDIKNAIAPFDEAILQTRPGYPIMQIATGSRVPNANSLPPWQARYDALCPPTPIFPHQRQVCSNIIEGSKIQGGVRGYEFLRVTAQEPINRS